MHGRGEEGGGGQTDGGEARRVAHFKRDRKWRPLRCNEARLRRSSMCDFIIIDAELICEDKVGEMGGERRRHK